MTGIGPGEEIVGPEVRSERDWPGYHIGNRRPDLNVSDIMENVHRGREGIYCSDEMRRKEWDREESVVRNLTIWD